MKSLFHLANHSPFNYYLRILKQFTIIKILMEDFQKYLSTAPVLLTIWMTFTAGFIIEINRFFPDMLGLYF